MPAEGKTWQYAPVTGTGREARIPQSTLEAQFGYRCWGPRQSPWLHSSVPGCHLSAEPAARLLLTHTASKAGEENKRRLVCRLAVLAEQAPCCSPGTPASYPGRGQKSPPCSSKLRYQRVWKKAGCFLSSTSLLLGVPSSTKSHSKCSTRFCLASSTQSQ